MTVMMVISDVSDILLALNFSLFLINDINLQCDKANDRTLLEAFKIL